MATKRKHGTIPGDLTNLQVDEPAFPRGGASALTPAEVQEVKEQAEAEFENEGNTKQKRQKRMGANEYCDRLSFGQMPKSIPMLKFKSLSVGMKILGVIQNIGAEDMIISLPGGLRGFVKRNKVADIFSSSCSNTENEDEEENAISLKELFSEKQLVPCVVISLDIQKEEENKKKSKRIGLSLNLSDLYSGLSIDSLHKGMVMQAFVTSVEDHGYLLSFGVPGIMGFLRSDKAGVYSSLKKGQLIQGFVESIDKKRGSVMLNADVELLTSYVTKEIEGLTLELLIPGTLVNARVRAVLKNGLLLSFLTYFTGTVSMFHLETPLPQSNWQEHYSENQRLKARILYVDHITKSIGLTLNRDLVQNKCPDIDVHVGQICEEMIVRRVDLAVGLLMELSVKDSSVAGYAHMSDVSDQHIERLQDKFEVGKKVKGRVMAKRLMDGLAVVTLKDSKIKQTLLTCMDVHPGDVVRGEIINVQEFGVFVKLSDGVKALCPLQHMSEFQRSKPSKKYQVGAKMKFRVLSCDVSAKRIILTRKKTLLASNLKPLTTYDDAVEGLVTHGWISGFEDYGCFVHFYNNVKGLAHRTELGLEPGGKPQSTFRLGEVVKCRVLRVDPVAHRLSLSFIISSDRVQTMQVSANAVQTVSVGDVVSGVVAYITDTTITFDIPLTHGVAKAVMKTELLSDSAGHMDQMKSVLYPGCKFERLLVLEKRDQKLIVTSKFSFLCAKSIPYDISQLNIGEVIPGYIASITAKGCFVRFLGGLTGLANLSQLANEFIHDPYQHFSEGQSVRAQVLEVNLESKRFTVSLKQSLCYSTDASLLQGYFQEEEKISEFQSKNLDGGADLDWEGIDIGKCIEGEIQDIKDYGVIVNLHGYKDIVGFVTHHQLGIKVEVGKDVKARILDVVKSDGIVDLTLRTELVESGGKLNTSKMKNSKKRRLGIQQKVSAVIELIKDEYLVLSLPDYDNVIGFASTHDYNMRVDPHEIYTLSQRIEATIGALPESSGVGRLLLLLTSFSDPVDNHMTKRRKRPSSNVDWNLVHGKVISVEPLEMKIQLDEHLVGKVHVTQVTDGFTEENPFKQYTVGQEITAKLLKKLRLTDGEKTKKIVGLTLRPSQLGSNESIGEDVPHHLPTFDSLNVGQIVTCYVKEVHEDWAWLLLSPTIMGRLFVLDSSVEPNELAHFKDHYKVGQPVRCRIIKIDRETGKLDLSIRALNSNSDISDIKVNDIFGGRISKIFPGAAGVSVQVGVNLYGRVHVTDLLDVWKDNPTNDFQEGQFVKCIVLDVNKGATGNLQIDLSLRDSLLNTSSNGRFPKNLIQNINDIKVDMVVEGFVKSITKKGCFVTLSRQVDARVLISNLSDSFIPDPEASFPVGKLVKGRIISIEPLSGFVEMSLRISQNDPLKNTVNQIFSVGDVVSGRIKRVESYGLFISLGNSDVVGLCHISEVSDDYIKDLQSHYEVNARVQVKILKISEDNKKISLGMKDSYFHRTQLEERIESTESSESKQQLEDAVSESSEEQDDVSEQDNEDYFSVSSHPPLPQFLHDDSSVSPLEIVLENNEPPNDVTVDEKQIDVSAGSHEEPQKSSKRVKKRLKEMREEVIKAAEQRRLEGDEVPQNAEDFEKLVHESPNSSFIWIKYMAFLLSLGDIDKARSIAERALVTINFREEGEKLNVWVALLNLENAYGTPVKEAVLGVFQRALQYCDPKKLYLALLGILERSTQHEMAEELMKTMTKKFKTSSKVWLRRIQYFLRQSMFDAAKKTLDRALLSLPNRKHIKLISQAAIAEFKMGSPEHGRNLFEGILRNYPKRSDLWSVYLDQEIALGDVLVTRSLFERATSLELAPKKMRSLFKKYLEFEKSHGDEDRVNYVKGKAMEYVESRT